MNNNILIEYENNDIINDKNIDFKVHIAVTSILEPLNIRCASCNKDFENDDIVVDMYNHYGGRYVIEELPLQWISIHCNCGYDTSISKLRLKEK